MVSFLKRLIRPGGSLKGPEEQAFTFNLNLHKRVGATVPRRPHIHLINTAVIIRQPRRIVSGLAAGVQHTHAAIQMGVADKNGTNPSAPGGKQHSPEGIALFDVHVEGACQMIASRKGRFVECDEDVVDSHGRVHKDAFYPTPPFLPDIPPFWLSL